jgi:oligosaccharide repeat unit polymerase
VLGFLFLIKQLDGEKYDLFNPALLITFQITVGFGVNTMYWHISDIQTEMFDLSLPGNQGTISKALLITFLGLLSFCSSFSLANLSSHRFSNSKSDSLEPFKISALIYLVTPVVLYYSIEVLDEVLSQGLGSFMLRNRYEKVENAYIGFVASSVQLYIVVSLHVASRVKEVSKASNLLLVVLLLLSFIVSISSGFRGNIIIFALHLLAIRNYRYKRFSRKGAMFFAALAVLLLAGLGNVRKEVELGSTGAISTEDGGLDFQKNFNEVLKRIQGAEIVSLVIQQIDQGTPHKYFYEAIYESITILIPRSLWPAKPESQSIIFGATFLTEYLVARDGLVGVNTGGFSYNLIGYLFWQAGYLGVIFGMTMLGLVLNYLYKYAEFHNFRGSAGVWYISIYARLWALTEAPQEGFNQVVFTFLFLGSIIFFSKERRSR